ncbi:aldose 1-epimerase family protein [Algoriphagus marinus]|uniref:aldose 1-epimerase family protein n=1 Tax=Algoriphagus marinus TaxID=1925762 RepID=UPI00094B9D76|nr:aldose 1-epimerase family protein [Algoriphagus marinus]
MKYHIESSDLRIQVNSIGMELSSIQSKNSNQEYLWQGNPAFWAGQAPVLFPIIGALKNGEMIYKGTTYSMEKHGLVRNSLKPKLISSGNNFLRFALSWDKESLIAYPFKFRLEIEFLLEGKTLLIKHHISNEGDDFMLYSIGGHPAFNCPLHSDEKYEDYYLQFPKEETDATCQIEPNGLIGLGRIPMLNQSKTIPLHSHLFDHDALVFKNLKSRKVSLEHQTRGPILAVEYQDFNYLGIWAKPSAPFVCIEPWLGIADSVDTNQNFEEKEGLLKLAPGESDQKSYSITILE